MIQMTPAAAPLHWVAADEQSYRGCQICVHGHTAPDSRQMCTKRSVAGGERAITAAEARAPGGACGPEAQHMVFPGEA